MGLKYLLPAVLLSLLLVSTFADVSVQEIKGVSNKGLLFSGNASVSDSSSNSLFFLFYGVQGVTDRTQLSKYPTLVVFGNPGSSSMYLNFGSIGPVLLTTSMTLKVNPDTPNTYANLLFIDPLGVGFSFAASISDIPTTYTASANQIVYALGQIQDNLDFGKGKLFLVGESSWIREIQVIGTIANVGGAIALSPWSELYAIGKYYGIAGVEQKIFNDSERITIESTFVNCYLNLKNGKYLEAHTCYDSVLSFVELKTNNHNLFNVAVNQSIIETFALVQYYLTVAANVNTFNAPRNLIFEQQSGIFINNVYVDQAKNYTQNISYFLRDYTDVKLLVLTGVQDYVCFYKATRNWMEVQLNFLESPSFKNATIEDVVVSNVTVARTKAVKQVAYYEILGAGHYVSMDKPTVVNSIIKNWISAASIEQPSNKNIRVEISE